MKKYGVIIGLCLTFCSALQANEFKKGPLIKAYGQHAQVEHTLGVNKNTKLNVAFDVSEQGKHDKENRHFNSLARFLNMHVANGVLAENIELALVVHGKAGFDLLNNASYQAAHQVNNPNHELISLLMKNNVKIYLCGQSASYLNIEGQQLQKGVQMALSAMTAHALLQNDGYTINPF
jgi:intracellular sulfur oxidation DsrE/DsrF family protein